MKELAALMGVSAGYLSQIANGGRPWTPGMREKVAAVLGEVPSQGTVYRQGGVVTGESSFIRERAREMGMTMKDLGDEAGVSYSYMTQVARGRQHRGVKVQARVESALKAPAKIAPAQCGNRSETLASGGSSFIRERARSLGMTMRELAEKAGVSCGYLSEISRGHREHGGEGPGPAGGGAGGCGEGRLRRVRQHRTPSPVGPDERPRVQPERDRPARRHQLLPPLPDHERQGQPLGSRSQGAARGAVQADEGGAGHARRGGRCWAGGRESGAGWWCTARAAPGAAQSPAAAPSGSAAGCPGARRRSSPTAPGYDGMGRLSVTHVVERGYSAMLKQPEPVAA